MQLTTPKNTSESAMITSSRDPLRITIWAAGIILPIIAAALFGRLSRRRSSHGQAVRDPGRDHPRLGASPPAGRVPDPGPRAHPGPRTQGHLRRRHPDAHRPPERAGQPGRRRRGRHARRPAGRPAPRPSARPPGLAVAVMANAASFLLPTSNITNLLLLGRVPLATAAYLSDSWLPWILVTAVTAGPLAWWTATPAGTDSCRRRRPLGPRRARPGADVPDRLRDPRAARHRPGAPRQLHRPARRSSPAGLRRQQPARRRSNTCQPEHPGCGQRSSPRPSGRAC